MSTALWLLACVRPPDVADDADTSSDTGDSSEEHESGDSTDSGDTADTATVGHEYTVCAEAADFSNIQAAVDAAAADGDTIRVCAGRFDGFVAYGKTLSIVGAGRDATVVGGGFPGYGVEWDSNYYREADASEMSYLSSLTISNPSFAARYGAALFVSDTLLTVRDVTIRDTPSQLSVIEFGGSTGAVTLDQVLVTGCVGPMFIGGHNAVITRSAFVENESSAGLISGELDISNTIIAFNTGSGPGYIMDSGEWDAHKTYEPLYQFTNNVVYGNVNTSETATSEPALRLNWSDVRNTIIADNDSAGLLVYDKNLIVQYNLAWDNTGEDMEVYGHAGPGPTDLVADPLFTDPENLDFTLLPGSPAIDAGSPDAAYNDPDGTRNDLGAFGGPLGDWTP